MGLTPPLLLRSSAGGGSSVEGSAVLSTGETIGKVLTADGDDSSSWQALAGGGDMVAANNLADVGSASTSLANLGLTALATELNLLDLSGLTAGWALLADSSTTASWQALPVGVSLIDDLSDVDTTTDTPAIGDTLVFDGTNWVTNLTQLIKEVDDVAGTTIYIGEAQPGTTTATAAWRVKRIVFTGDDSETLYADGNVNFDNTWTGRAGFSYS